ncbi:hypothetical protein Ahy_B07g086863 [Arachis hypogaea]|uniref:Protein FAR1-RELATED SEQUENCE n=1 Tax=Arachis hypogaea TaxID=3818 RepID=A0A444YAM8_ARAHY|nr:hypothetical protein Ahy_B07g086863 [Arachis hypogaea]
MSKQSFAKRVIAISMQFMNKPDENTRYVTYHVHFDRSTHKVRCECNLFESSDILCCHYLVVFSSYKVNRVPSCYVLTRWSKNIKRKHTYIKSSHDVRR